jgi:hypothetical protein
LPLAAAMRRSNTLHAVPAFKLRRTHQLDCNSCGNGKEFLTVGLSLCSPRPNSYPFVSHQESVPSLRASKIAHRHEQLLDHSILGLRGAPHVHGSYSLATALARACASRVSSSTMRCKPLGVSALVFLRAGTININHPLFCMISSTIRESPAPPGL